MQKRNRDHAPRGNGLGTDMISAFDSLPIAAAVLDRWGTVLRANEAFQADFEAAAGADFAALARLLGADEMALNRLTETLDSPDGGETEITIAGEEVRRLSFAVRPVPGKDGHRAVTVREVTTRNDEMRRLEQARDKAQAANRSKSDFVANVSHEMRTPINGILGLTEILLDGRLDREQERLAESVRECGDALLAVVDDLLDMAKLEAGVLELEQRDFALRDLVYGVVNLVGPRARRKNLPLRVLVEDGVPCNLRGDSARLRQILLNLASNAVKFTETGNITIRVSRNDTSAPNVLRFAVIDTGMGIPADRQSRLFARFVQADTTIAGKYGGTGLGLAICKSLVELMDGDIGLTSEIGAGSVFWFTVPLALAAGGTPARECARGEDAATPSLGRAPSVLVADDNRVNRLLASTALLRRGHRVDTVINGKTAVDSVAQGDYDAIVMDLTMPGLDGLEATVRIRALPGDKGQIPIIALTAHASPETAADCLTTGMNDYVSKPFTAEDLTATVERWADRPATEQVPPLATESTVPAG